MKVQEYRDLIDNVFDTLRSARSAATSHEQRLECLRLRRAWGELAATSCAHLSERDMARVDNAERQVRVFLEERQKEFDAADANLARMAFGAEWR